MGLTELVDTYRGAELLGVTANAFRVAVHRARLTPVGHAAFGPGRPRSLYLRAEVEALAATRRRRKMMPTVGD